MAGLRLPHLREVTGWLEACGADDATRREVLALLNAAHSGSESWVTADPRGPQELVDGLTASARTVWGFSTAVVPGLLQSAEYARRAIALDPARRTDPADALARRMDRQQVLYEPDRSFRFVIAARVLHRGLGDPGVLEVQRAHLRTLAGRPNVEVLALPSDAVVADSVPFTLYADRPDGPDTVTIEAPHGMVTVAGADEVDVYRGLFDRLAAAAGGV